MKTLLLLTSLMFTSALFANDGAALFKSCASCHGAKAEKPALNKSQIIAGWSADKTIAALKGYQNGTYGGPLKGTMTGQVKPLDDAKITALATYIQGLK